MLTRPDLLALMGCLAGYGAASLGLVDAQLAQGLTSFLPTVAGLAAYAVARHLDQ